MDLPLCTGCRQPLYSPAVPPPMERCPSCGGRLGYHGHFERQVAENGVLEPLVLFRGICRNPCCPVVTVTHYPPFVTPYSVHRTAVREAAILESLARGLEVAAMAVGCSVRTVLRWRQALGERLGELVSGVAGLIMRLDPLWPLPSEQAGLPAAFTLLSRARELTLGRESPLLAVGRLRPAWPSVLPVFV